MWSAPRGRGAPYRGVKVPDSYDIPFTPPPCRTLADMTPAEIAALEAQYGAKVVRKTKLRSSVP